MLTIFASYQEKAATTIIIRATMAPRKAAAAPMTKGRSPSKLKTAKKNEHGEIINWDSAWPDAVYLRLLVEQGMVDGLTAGQIQHQYPQFRVYTNKTLTGGLKTVRDSVSKEVATARTNGSEGMLPRLDAACSY